MHGRTWRLGAAIIGAVVAVGTAAGSAAAAAPTPGCQGTLYTDPRGDQSDKRIQLVNPNGLLDPLVLPAGDNSDIVDAFLTTDADGTTKINIHLADANKTVPTGASAMSWYFGYKIDGVNTPEFVSASTDGKTYTFNYGHYDKLYRTDGTTAGEVTEGKDGVVSIILPDPFEGDTIKETYVESFIETGVGNPSVVYASSLSPADSAPDDGGEGGTNAGSYTVAPCV